MSFVVNKTEWDSLSAEDHAFIHDHVRKGYPDPDTAYEVIELPSGKEFRVYCDGRGFIQPQGLDNPGEARYDGWQRR